MLEQAFGAIKVTKNKKAVQDSLKRLHLYEILLERDVNVLAATFVEIEKTSVSGCATL